jgi:hypothetical protein
MVGMTLMNSPRISTHISSLTNRTIESGGSIGGNIKAGIWTGSPYMSINNIGNSYTYRIPQQIPNIRQMIFLTTRYPLQYKRGSYTVTHSGTLLG